MLELLHGWTETVVSSPWALVVVLVVVTVDGFFPVVPSEMLVIGLAASAAAGTGPSVWMVVAAAAAGAVAGDTTAYLIGRTLPIHRWRITRAPRVSAAFDWARVALRHRPAGFILTARFVPVGRVAVTMTAGATGLPWARFLPVVCLADVMWAGYSTAIGVGAGLWLGDQPLVAMLAGMAGGLVLGFGADAVIGQVRRVRVHGKTPAQDPRGPLTGVLSVHGS